MNKIILKIAAAVLAVGLLTSCGAVESGSSALPSDASDSVESSAPTSVTEAVSTEAANSTETEEPTVTPINREPDYEWDKVIALTFDDGPNTVTTPQVLDLLEKHQVVASFFLIGNNITDESAKVVKRAYDLGCEIDNHSKSHSYMNELETAEEILAEFDFVDEKVYEITGEHTKFFRPPYIAVSDMMWENIGVPFISGVGCNDWDPKITAERRAMKILKLAKDGDIILLHDAEGNSATVEALEEIIPELKARGYKFVTVTELFEEKGIEPASQIIYSNASQTTMWG